ncbi:MAG: hypothetical protein IPQ05_20570 [Leptospiraceae bacterium]|nr:hypothetical protein [Leptospiraceae bacterium]
MAISEYREDFSSLIPALHLLMNLGYNYLNPTEALRLRREKNKPSSFGFGFTRTIKEV